MTRWSARCLMLALAAVSSIATASAQTLSRSNGPEPESLDPRHARSTAAFNILRDVYEGLTTLDAAGEPVPGVAESWTVSDDGLTWRFELRADARWSNGDPVVAEDFLRAWERFELDDSRSPMREWLDLFRGGADSAIARARGERELVIRLRRPDPALLYRLAHPVFAPMPAGQAGPQLPAPAGRVVNGAYRWAEHRLNSHSRLVRNENFHARADVKIEAVKHVVSDDAGAAMRRFQAGELHITDSVPAAFRFDRAPELAEQLRVSPYLGVFWVGVNRQRGALAQFDALPAALYYALKRDIIAGKLLGNGERPADSVVPRSMPAYLPPRFSDVSRWPDLASAAQDLRAAGWQDGMLQYTFNTHGNQRRLALVMRAMWQQALALRINLQAMEWQAFVGARQRGANTELFRGAWIADFPSPENFLALFAHGRAEASYGFSSALFDHLYELALHEPRPELRSALFAQAESVLLDSGAVIPVYEYVSRHLVAPEVLGWQDNPLDVHPSRYLRLRAQP